MKKPLLTALLLWLGGIAAAQNSTPHLQIDPSARIAPLGSVVTYAVLYSSNGYPAVFGAIDVVYDTSILDLIDYQYGRLGNPAIDKIPQKLTGRLQDLAIARFDRPLREGLMVTLTFRVVGQGTGFISIEPSTRYGADWPSPFPDIIDRPTYTSGFLATPKHSFPLLDVDSVHRSEPIALGTVGEINVPVSNQGSAPLVVHTVSLVQDEPNLFLIEDPCSGAELAPSAVCVVKVGYAATEYLRTRYAYAALEVQTSDWVRPQIAVDLFASIASPRLSLSQLQFFEAATQAPYDRRAMTITNIGDAPTTISGFNWSVFLESELPVVEQDCKGVMLAPGESCDVVLEYRAVEGQNDHGFFIAAYDLWGNQGFVEGSPPTGLPLLHYDGPREWDMVVGEEQLRTFTITNQGSVDLNLMRNSWPDSTSWYTVISNECRKVSLAMGQSCALKVLFKPTEVGEFSRWFYFSSDSLYLASPVFMTRVTAHLN